MIAFVQDDNFEEMDIGGAGSNDKRMTEFLRKERGLEVDIITPRNYPLRINKNYELIVFSNCCLFSDAQLKALADKGPYIIFTHDYYFCRMRLNFPARLTCRKCPKVKFWTEMHRNAKLNIFLSPLHRKMHEIVFDKEVLGRDCFIPSAMDVDFWHRVEGTERVPNSFLVVNGLLPYKGRYNVYAEMKKAVEEHPEFKFTIVGGGNPFTDIHNFTYLGHQSKEQLRMLYSSHQYLLMLPPTPQPFEQVFIEGLLCGIKVLANKNVGAVSYKSLGWDFTNLDQIRNYMKQAAVGFADEIYGVLEPIRDNKS